MAVGLLIFGTSVCSNFVATQSVPESTVVPRRVPATPFSVVEQCWLIPAKNLLSAYSSAKAASHNGRTLVSKSFHEKAGRGQGILRFFLSVSLFPFS